MWTDLNTRQQKGEASAYRTFRARRSSRRGVLMLVVLSMLVLFMLIGTAFLMSSSQEQKTAAAAAKANRLGNDPTQLIYRALLGAVRDTENPHSVIRYHSLLRDLYGTNGFQAVATGATYARQIVPTTDSSFNAIMVPPRGATEGQFIDLYIVPDPVPNDFAPTVDTDESITNLTLANVLKLDRDPLGRPQRFQLPMTRGYFNGCVLTMTSGPASGQSTRIVDYQFVGDDPAVRNLFPTTTFPTTPDPIDNTGPPKWARIWRLRVMAINRTDGRALSVAASVSPAPPALTDLTNQTFMVNGRAFSGTGVGYNPLAQPGTPRLSAVESILMGTYPAAMPVALAPNSVYSFLSDPNPDPAVKDIRGIFDLSNPANPIPLNPKITTTMTASPVKVTQNLATWKYPSFVGLGDANESYDAADFQNMAIALQTVTPRSQGRVVQGDSANPTTLSAVDPNLDPSKFLRLDLEDLPLPSFHRPDLVNYWYHQLLGLLKNAPYNMDANTAAQAIIDPYPNGQLRTGLDPSIAAVITAVKRKAIMRPLREDNPHFDGSNPLSVPSTLPTNIVDTATKSMITIPYWEAVGPWDVDNDNDGVPDSVWVDIGDPVQEAEDGTRYKPLYAYLIVDLDSRLNVNAHGLADDIISPLDDPTRGPFFDPTARDRTWVGNMAHDTTNPNAPKSTLQLSRGLGYGPAEISLRPIFPAPITEPELSANRDESTGPIDDYATALFGRRKQDGSTVPGKYGYDPNLAFPHFSKADAKTGGMTTAGTNYRYEPIVQAKEPATSPRRFTGEQATPSLLGQLKFFDYPWAASQPSAFGTLPDLKGRYALGLDYYGQPVYEVAADANPNNSSLRFNLLANSPYELNLSSAQRRDDSSYAFQDQATAFNASIDRSFNRVYDPTAQIGVNDDAAFSPSDLEKVLRGWDPDIGTLPSRLWDVVSAFDPQKLIRFNPNYTANFADSLLGLNNVAAPAVGKQASPEMMTGAQQLAGINRRLVTTDSFDLPVATPTMPGYVSEFGPDGAPGRRNDTLHNTLNLAFTDDFQAVTGVQRAQAKIIDLLYYRVWLEARRFIMRTQGLTEVGPSNSLDSLSWTDYQEFMRLVKIRADWVFSHLASDLLAPEVIAGKKMDLNRPFGDGKDNPDPFDTSANPVGDGVVDDPMEAGEPFLDINGNGKMDYDTSGRPLEPYLDLNNNGKYDPPRDQLWSNLTATGQLAEPITFDYTNGHAEPVHAVVANAIQLAFKQTLAGGVRNLESQGRQLFARHLYCLMLLLVDENYIAPWDENDAQVATWMVNERNKLTSPKSPFTLPPLTAAEADLVVKRKATCRMIAQWAVNVVDARDPDAIMTPFEYDENPWDGWGVWDDKWIGDNSNASFIKIKKDPTLATFLPLDGDPATDENNAWVIDWTVATPANVAISKTLKQFLVDQSKPINLDPTKPPLNLPIVSHPLLQTRGVVWGAERPELLMTETLAFHDRQTEDLASPNSDGHGEMTHYDKPGETKYHDPDPDQALRPRGSLFVEVYNPWSPDGQLPAELYSRLDSTTGYLPKFYGNTSPTQRDGVELGRLSNYGWDEIGNKLTLEPTIVNGTSNTAPTKNIKRSPVWRIVVVEEWPGYRNSDPIDGQRLDEAIDATYKATDAFKVPEKIYNAMKAKVALWNPTVSLVPPFRPTDPDFDAAFNPAFLPKQKAAGQNIFNVQFPFPEREFYFTTDNSPVLADTQAKRLYFDITPDYNYSPNVFKLRLPYRTVTIDYGTAVSGTIKPKPGRMQKFPPPGLESAHAGLKEEPIAPIAPGRYGVIGSAGSQYAQTPVNTGTTTTPFTTTIGRKSDSVDGIDRSHDPKQVRRIELNPSNNSERTQVVVASNGGDPKDEIHLQGQTDPTTVELGRDNELINDRGSVKNITQPRATFDANNQDSQYYQPSVAIPVKGMNISEPAWGYAARELDAAKTEAALRRTGSTPQIFVYKTVPTTTTKNFEGRYYATTADDAPMTPYDKPFDGSLEAPVAPELMRTGTTPNYRTIHLQRLANPMLPWNPPPGQFFEPDPTNPLVQKDMYRPNMPINPYRTIDTASVNMTAFNGVSEAETRYPSQAPGYTNAQSKFLQMRPWVRTEKDEKTATNAAGYFGNLNQEKQVFSFQSVERGNWARLNMAGMIAQTTTDFRPQRVLWAQEPALTRLSMPIPNNPTNPRARQLFDLTPGRQMTMMSAPDSTENEVPSQIKTDENIQPSHINMVLEQTLGFGNNSYGLLYDKKGTKQAGQTPPTVNQAASSVAPSAAAVGAPAPFTFTWSTALKAKSTSTYPWLNWNNRPFVSEDELLTIPMASQSAMLKQYSIEDPKVLPANRPNPYGLTELGIKPVTPTFVIVKNATRWAVMQTPFGQLPNVFASASQPADAIRDSDLVGTGSPLPSGYVVTGSPVRFDKNDAPILPDTLPAKDGDIRPYGAPNFYRILDYVHVPSRYVGTDTMLTAETFNDVPSNVPNPNTANPEPVGTDITGPTDPRMNFQPPFNKVSRERNPGKVNLNTVTGRRIPGSSTAAAQIWSEVYDGIMHRLHDGNSLASQLAQPGPAWRDVALSRRGYIQVDAQGGSVDKPSTGLPDTLQFGLNNSFPTMFANPFRSGDAGDLVPVQQMMQYGVDATFLRKHPYDRAMDAKQVRLSWGQSPPTFGDARDAGFDESPFPPPPAVRSAPSFRLPNGTIPGGAIPSDNFNPNPSNGGQIRDSLPLFSEARGDAFSDTDRNPYMMYQPMSRLGNLVTDHSNVYAIWITVGYFEVEKAPDWNDTNPTTMASVRARFGATTNDTDPATIAGLALYNRVYPDGYMLGKELGSDTGDTKRPRGFYIIDRSEPVGFRPGEDLNVEKMIRLRRRIQ